jgi:hypothetical protein
MTLTRRVTFLVLLALSGCRYPEPGQQEGEVHRPTCCFCPNPLKVALPHDLPSKIRVVVDGRELVNECAGGQRQGSSRELILDGYWFGSLPAELRIDDLGSCTPSTPAAPVLSNLVGAEWAATDVCCGEFRGRAEGGLLLPPLSPAPRGEWAGRGARLVVQAEGARLTLDCASGDLDPILLDSQGRFSSRGTLRLGDGSTGQALVEGSLSKESADFRIRSTPEAPALDLAFRLKRSAAPEFAACR